MSATSLVDKIKTALEKRGAWVIKYHGSAFGRAGIPDLLACHRGQFAGLEVKSGKGEPTATQLREIAKIQKAGGSAQVVRSVEDALAVLDALSAGKAEGCCRCEGGVQDAESDGFRPRARKEQAP